MKIIKNEKLIKRNGKIGQWTSIAALVVLGQRISPLEAAAMAAVMAAAAGASWTSGGAAEAGVDLPAP